MKCICIHYTSVQAGNGVQLKFMFGEFNQKINGESFSNFVDTLAYSMCEQMLISPIKRLLCEKVTMTLSHNHRRERLTCIRCVCASLNFLSVCVPGSVQGDTETSFMTFSLQ